MIYFLLLLSGLLFALQFCTNKYFQSCKPDGETSSVSFTLLGKAAATAVFFVCLLCRHTALFGNGYTILIGVLQAALNLIIMLLGIKVLAIGSVGTYTVFMTIGGMSVPAVFGVCFLGDELRYTQLLAFVLIVVAVILSARGEKKKLSLKALIFYLLLFFGNGMYGALTALHTNRLGVEVPDVTFMFVTSWVAVLCTLPVSAAVYVKEKKAGVMTAQRSELKPAAKALYRRSPYLSGILNGVANLLIVIGTTADGIGSVVVFPLMTGGTILFTTIFSWLFYKEKPSGGKWISVALILAALVIFIL